MNTSVAPSDESKGNPPLPLEIQLVDQDLAKELQCGICLQILNKPRQCKNGHLFCHNCISQYILKSPVCPSCRCSLKENELARSLFVERHLRQLRVFCKYHFCRDEEIKDWKADTEGCSEVFPHENVQAHEKTCEFAFIQCRFSSRCEPFRKKELDKHEKKCPYRPWECPHCKLPVERTKIENHLEECMMIPIICTKCSQTVKRGELEFHKQNLCPEEFISCPFQGCEEKIVRKELSKHLTEEASSHLLLLKKSFDDQLNIIDQKYNRELQAKEERIKSLEKLMSENGNIKVMSNKYKETRIEWKIKNWTQAKKKSYLQSEKFNFADFTWFIGFYTDGDNEESRGYISVYLFLDVQNQPKNKNVTIEFQIKFVNHKDPNECVKKEFKATFPIKGGQGWGDRKAIKHSRITDESGYLKNDTFLIEAQISLKKVLWSFP